MKITNQQQQSAPISINGINLKEVTSFTYLGSVVSTTGGGTDEDLEVRIGKARQAFINLNSIWKSSAIRKTRIFNTNVKSFLLYGSETWRVKKRISNRLPSLSPYWRSNGWTERISNKKLWDRTNQEPITQIICRRKWRWIGHCLRRPLNDITRKALEWNPSGKRKVGRHCKGDMEEILQRRGKSLWSKVVPVEEDSRKQDKLEMCRWSPMFHEELKETAII